MHGLNGLGEPNLYSVWRRRSDGATREVVSREWRGGGGSRGERSFVHTDRPAVSMFSRFPYNADWWNRKARRPERVRLSRFLDLHEPFPDQAAADLARRIANAGEQLTLPQWQAGRRRR